MQFSDHLRCNSARKFLDGCYPMRVSMTVRPVTDKLRFVGIPPEAQRGFGV